MSPPTARKTTAATALALIKLCAATSTLSPVYWQTRDSAFFATAPMTVSAVMMLSPRCRALFRFRALVVRDVNLARHRMMADPAKLVADDAELAGLGRR